MNELLKFAARFSKFRLVAEIAASLTGYSLDPDCEWVDCTHCQGRGARLFDLVECRQCRGSGEAQAEDER